MHIVNGRGERSISERRSPARKSRARAEAGDAEIVVYRRGEYCVLAYDAARLPGDRGRRVIRPHDGMVEWRLAEPPAETGDPA
ncbi:hypothetical protein [Actinomadura sp. GC306]|uniref:hypothetical protein n=1 Tax=Actinomadura sp. GC306 TaxID=2530367 RepID=UPI001A9FF3AB|nr:hypothetical protein [Actinomadura sp. GC306]